MKAKLAGNGVVALASMMLACFTAFADGVGYSAAFTVSGYTGTTELTNFPVLVRLADGSPTGFSYSDCATGGSDIRFRDADGNLVPHEIDTWDTTGGSLIWVGLPVMTNGTAFTMHYGASDPGASATGDVWARYVAVVHGGDSITNSVAGGPTATAGSAAVTASADAGKIGGGVNKSSNNSIGINVATPAAKLSDTGKFSVSAWFKRNGNGSGNGTHILGASRSAWNSGTGYLWLQEQGKYIDVAANSSHQFSTGNYTLPDGVWAHAAFSYDSGASLTTYFNGAQDNQKTSGVSNLVSTAATWTFGSYQNTASADSFMGDMDELRIFDGVASGDWFKAECDAATNSAFLAAGPSSAIVSPILSTETLPAGVDAVDVRVIVDSAGQDASSCDLYLAYAQAGDALPDWTLVASDLAAGATRTCRLAGLVEDADYDYAFMASNSLGRTSVKPGTFKTGLGFKRPDPSVAEFSRGVKFTVMGYAGTQELTNFPVLVRLSNNSPSGFSYADFYNPGDVAGADLCFLDADGNGIPHEIDTWNPNGESLVWVTLPRMTNGTEFAMWYRSSKSGSAVCAANAWEDYTGVWHLGEGGDGVQSVYDSTSNALTGVTHANSSAQSAGRIGGSRRVSTKGGASDANGRILVSLSDPTKRAAVDALAADGSDKTFTASLWMRPRGGTDYCYLIGRKENDTYKAWGAQFNNYSSGWYTSMRVYSAGGRDSESKEVSVTSTGNGVWRKIDIVWTKTTYTIYYDGGASSWTGELNAANGQEPLNGSSDLAFGGTTSSGYGSMNGELDEVRLRVGDMGADWVKADYDTVNNASFVRGGAVVALVETPRPIATLALSDSSARYAQFRGSIGNCGGEATACTAYCKVWKTTEAEPSAWTLLAGGLGEGDVFSQTVSGLDPETDYSYKIKAVNNLETPVDSETVEGTFTTGGTGSGGTGGERYRVGNDYVHVFEIEQGSDVNSFEFTPPGYVSSVRALVVAGGGPGGYQRGGGGGAGGLVYDDALLVTGGATYTINVGTGGVASTSAAAYGSNGGPSSIYLGQDAVVTTLGGGAGGNGSSQTAGVAGGSGGGAGGASTTAGAGTPGQGNAGGIRGINKDRATGGGGGGAGRAGSAGSNDTPPSGGSGGQGFLTDISGTSTWYAGGGGGGGFQGGTASNSGSPGGGGDGGGGRGGMAIPSGMANPSFGPAAVAGQNGLGGGGGGGSDVNGFYQGGNGGNGIVIVRYTVQGSGAGSAEPVVSLTGVTYAGDLKITGTYRVAWAGEGANDADVYIKWGYAANSLTHSVRVAQNTIGTGSFEITVPVDQTTIYLRAMADNGTAQGLSDEIVPIYVPEFAGEVPGDTTIPVLGAVSASHVDGLFARLSGTVASFGTAGAGEDAITNCVVYALVGTSDNVSRMTAHQEMEVAANTAFSYAIDGLTPGTTYYWCLEARNSAGVAVSTQVGSFTTLPEHTVANAVSANNAQRTVNLSGSLAQVGAGTTDIAVRWKEGGGAWGDWTTVKAVDGSSATTAFNVGHSSANWNTTIYWEVCFSNQSVTSSGALVGEPWVTKQSGNFATGDRATYTWQAAGGDWNGSWTNAEHWACNQADRLDYPNGANVTVAFSNNTVATIEVPGSYVVKDCSMLVTGVNLTFVGEGAETSGLSGNFAGSGDMSNSSWTFSAMTFAEANGIEFGGTATVNATFALTNGASATMGTGGMNLCGSNVWLVVAGNSSFGSRVGNGTKDGGIRLDDGTVSGSFFRTDLNWTETTNEWVIIQGASSRLTATESFRNDSDEEAYLQNADTTFLFSVPRSGWAEAPLYAEYSSAEKFGGMKGNGAGGYVVSVDPESPALAAGNTRAVQLVEWKSGIDTDHVRLAGELPESVTLSWTYGWPSTLSEPENEGDAPTGVKATITGRSKRTMIVVW